MTFRNRTDAGEQLGRALSKYKGRQPAVFALPRGGVPVAAAVAAALEAPLDLVLVRKIGVPYEPELAMGAVADGQSPVVVRNEDIIRALAIDEQEFQTACDTELAEIERRHKLYIGNRERVDAAGRTAIVIDDGIATGATTRAALRAVRSRKPSTLVLAVPIAPAENLDALRSEVDELICLERHQVFGAIGLYYDDFRQVSDQEVIATLQRFARRPPDQAHTA